VKCGTSREVHEQVTWLYSQSLRQLDDVLQGHISLSTLNSADIVPMQSCPFGQFFLRIAPLVAELPQPGAKLRLNGMCGHTPMLDS